MTDLPPDTFAIIGMAGRFPGAGDVGALWRNLRDGVESISFFDGSEAPPAPTGPRVVNAAGLLDDIEQFDYDFFGISPRDAALMDPQHRLFLECCWSALESAGYIPDAVPGRVGVYAGASPNTYVHTVILPHTRLGQNPFDLRTLVANDASFLASYVAYKLALQGPAVSIATACSTSLVAVHLACKALLDIECDFALAGGVRVRVPQKTGYLHQEGGIGSPDGHCRAFDSAAQGTVSGSGVGVVVLKRLVDALDHNDTVLALIRGSAINNDGARKVGFTAPSVSGQAEVIAEALATAGIDPETVSYVETHGTGTMLGDRIEIAALHEVFGVERAPGRQCLIGSVKPNIGHLDAAAGVAGLIKVVLAMRHGILPPSLHVRTPNQEFARAPSLRVVAAATPWDRDGGPYRAGVSSFGIGGTNAHVVLEEAPPPLTTAPGRPWQVLALSARSPAALAAQAANLARHLETGAVPSLADVAFTLAVGRTAFAYRRAIIGRDQADVVARLREPGGCVAALDNARQVAFIFSDRQPPSCAELYAYEDGFRRDIDRCRDWLAAIAGIDLPGDAVAAGMVDPMDASASAAAALAVQWALAQLLLRWGVVPDVVAGAGVGDIAAACLAGALPLETSLHLAIALHAGGYAKPAAPDTVLIATALGGAPQPATQRRWLSGTAGREAVSQEAIDPAFWCRPGPPVGGLGAVRDAIGRETGRLLVAIGGDLDMHPDDFIAMPLPGPGGERSDLAGALGVLGQLWVAGIPVDWRTFYAGGHRRVPLPTYPFEGRHCWLDGPIVAEAAPPAETPARLADLADWFSVPEWRLAAPAYPAPARPVDGRLLVLADEAGFAEEFTARAAGAGEKVGILAAPGATPTNRADWQLALERAGLGAGGAWTILHCAGLSADLAIPEELFAGLLAFMQGLSDVLMAPGASPTAVRVIVAATGLHAVTAAEPIDPAKAVLLGPCLVMPIELPGVTCLALDIDLGAASSPARTRAIEALWRECATPSDEPVVALRGLERWVRRFAPLRPLGEPEQPPALRQHGVYLITGGFGLIGRELAAVLAAEVGARLVLVGRHDVPGDILAAEVVGEADTPALAARAEHVEALRQLGATVTTAACDIADRATLSRLRAVILERFGALHGIIHAAGLPPEGLTTRKTAEMAARVLRPKVAGTLALAETFGDMDLDFVLLCSSPCSIMSFPGAIDYSAANAFLDAFARASWADGRTAYRSLLWDGWQDTNMGSRPTRGASAGKALLGHEGITAEEGREVFRRALGMPMSAPVLVVSSRPLERVIEHMRQTIIPAQVLAGHVPPRGEGAQMRPALAIPYAAPQTAKEIAVAAVWEELLGVRPIGIDDNFYDLGGDSVVTLQIAARLTEAGLCLDLHSLFALVTVREVATALEAAQTPQALAVPDEALVPLMPIQRWFFALDLAAPQHFNQAVVVQAPFLVVPERLRGALRSIVERHDALRLRFHRDAAGWEQRYAPTLGPMLVRFEDLAGLSPEGRRAVLEASGSELQARLDIAEGPLIAAAVFMDGDAGTSLVLLVAHHLVIDTMSWSILLADLTVAYHAAVRGEAPAWPAAPAPFGRYALDLERRVANGEHADEELYWQAVAARAAAAGRFPLAGHGRSAATMSRSLAAAVPSAGGARLQAMVLAALAWALTQPMGDSGILIAIEGLGRDMAGVGIDLSRTIGWFTSVYPVVLPVARSMAPAAALGFVDEELHRVPRRGIGFSHLRYLAPDTPARRAASTVTMPEVSFVFLGRFDQRDRVAGDFVLTDLPAGPTRSPLNRLPYAVEVTAVVRHDELQITFAIDTSRLDEIVGRQLVDDTGTFLRRLAALSGEATPVDDLDYLIGQIRIGANRAADGAATE